MKSIMVLLKDVPKAVKFYKEGLGCQVNFASENWAEVSSGNYLLQFNRVDSEASCTHGYSPFFCFHVKNLDSTIYKLLELGDGPIKYPEHGKIASIRGPDGCMIGLFEPSEIYHRMMPK